MKKLFFAAILSAGLASCVLDESAQKSEQPSRAGEQASALKGDDSPVAQAYCGDNSCNGNERPETCPEDCSICGDGVCYAHESLYCPEDCCYSTPEECGG